MKKISSLVIALFLATTLTTQAQNVGIGATTFTPNASAGLDVDFTDRGLLIPRVILGATNAAGPVTGPATSLLVYNTATAGAAPNNVTPGYYYWNGSAWVRFLSAADAWTTKGNAGTAIATNFLGTTDDVAFAIRTNNIERMRVTTGTAAAGGQVVINNTTPVSYDVLSAYANSTKDQAIAGYANTFSGGTGVYGVTNNNAGVYGEAANGVGVYGINNSAIYGAVSGYNTNVASGIGGIFAGNGLSGGALLGIGAGVTGIAKGVGVYGEAVYTASNFSDGVRGVADITNGTGVRGTSNTASGLAVLGLTSNASSLAALFSGNGAASSYPAAGGGVAGNGTTFGVSGYAGGANGSAGGYFQTGTAYAYVGVRNAGTNYKIIGSASNSTIVRDLENKRVTMFSPEAPEILFQDFGKGELINGKAHIDLDPIFAKNIKVNAKHPLRVFVQLEGDCNGVFITNKTASSFDVKELQNGNSTVAFTWFVTGSRIDDINPETGVLESKHEGVRFPEAPGPQETKVRDTGPEQKTEYTNLKSRTNK